MVRVQLFAGAKEAVGADSIEVSLASTDTTFGDLQRCMAQQHPELAGLLLHSRFAADNEYVVSSSVMKNTGEIALIPPVSGG